MASNEVLDENKLIDDLMYRVTYVTKFIEFTGEDHERILELNELLVPLVGPITDAVYVKNFSYDITKESFTMKQEFFEDNINANVKTLKLDDPIIKFRKTMLSKYIKKLVTMPLDAKKIKYLDWVGEIHTDTKTKKSKINVEYIHCNALMGFVAGALLNIVQTATQEQLNITPEKKRQAVVALSKLLWVQNDLFVRHYIPREDSELMIARNKRLLKKERTPPLTVLKLFGSTLGTFVVGIAATVGALSFLSK
ncbi:hypothetical protein BB559_001181 [Furculomyces boomerangus]|uniref:Globin-sensor domain-containing protein n=1 Tax=Furculomyces boomerangus TaxID=61424 RepID=A0A2T9Z2Y0_9FUNG|nr:hypothetical protein BB559_001181 [Furculomyces boomerangus]